MKPITIKSLIRQCNKHLNSNVLTCKKCTRKAKCKIFIELYGTTPYLMNNLRMAEAHDFDYKSLKDFVI